jgi:Tetracyclin repressor-like, C-terminal domain
VLSNADLPVLGGIGVVPDGVRHLAFWRLADPGVARLGHQRCPGRECPRPGGSLAGQLAETDPQARAQIAMGFEQWSASIGDGLRNLHAAGHLPAGTDPDDLAVTLLAAIQGGLLLAQVQHDTRPLETAVDTLLALAARQ